MKKTKFKFKFKKGERVVITTDQVPYTVRDVPPGTIGTVMMCQKRTDGDPLNLQYYVSYPNPPWGVERWWFGERHLAKEDLNVMQAPDFTLEELEAAAQIVSQMP